MELRKLNTGDYDQLLDLLNVVFTKQNGHPMDFLNELPKMWVCDDRHMGYHTGVFEDGKLVAVGGCYPLPLKIGETSLLFATTGNMATLPEYEGRGYFNRIFTELMHRLEEMGADGARLGGSRTRYARFGYEPAGLAYNITLNEKNRVKYFQNLGAELEFREIRSGDVDLLEFCNALSRKADFYVERSSEENYRDVYLALCSKHAAPYVALKDGVPVGYLAATSNKQYIGRAVKGREIRELRYTSVEQFLPIVCAWQRYVNDSISFQLAPYMAEELRLIVPGAENVSVASPSRFKILNYEKLADALLKLKHSKHPLMNGEFVLGIEDYGTIRLYVDGNVAGCEKSQKTPVCTVDKRTATRLLFGHLPPYASTALSDPLLGNWLPLPLSWVTLDYV